MMKLATLIHDFTTVTLPDKLAQVVVDDLVNDSRHIVSGSVFIAARGIRSHGLDHLTSAQCEQVAAVLYQPPYSLSAFQKDKAKFIAIDQLAEKAGLLARRFYAATFPQPLIGITGTNGKTSVSHFVAQLSNYAVIGTMGYGRPQQLTELSHTTPDAVSLQKILLTLSKTAAGVAMEISSHALSLNRVDAVEIAIAVFTNISQDHLDFHENMATYQAAKMRLFAFPSLQAAVLNVDDDWGYQLAKKCQKKGLNVLVYGQNQRVFEFSQRVHLSHLVLSTSGISVNLSMSIAGFQKNRPLFIPVWGGFNAYNLVAAMLALVAAGYSIDDLLQKAGTVKGVVGRMDFLPLGDGKTAVIDYAHTPDALISTLSSLRQQTKGRIYTVFGCGGDRDKTKRPLMAEAVNKYSDFGIVTDDNPRTENSQDIIADILTGAIEPIRFQVIASRKAAIDFGLSQLHPGDVLLIAGKGHETYQIIGTEKQKFSDYDVVKEWLNETH